MKWLRIISLQFEEIFEYKLKSLVWLLLPLMNNLTLILFWTGAQFQSGLHTSLDSLTTYYFLMTVCGLFLSSHVEYEVSELHIKQGGLINYLLKPVSYYWMQLFEELPHRVLQAVYAVILVGYIALITHTNVSIGIRWQYAPVLLCIFIFGYLISYTIKLSIAFIAFWIKEIGGISELFTIVIIIFSGGILPIPLYPEVLKNIAYKLPFIYVGYYPVTSLQGLYDLGGLLRILGVQIVWYGGLIVMNRILWMRGLKRFTAVGQ